jgi:hypothetical protein
MFPRLHHGRERTNGNSGLPLGKALLDGVVLHAISCIRKSKLGLGEPYVDRQLMMEAYDV